MMRIVMDSAGDLPLGWKEAYEIDVIPINIHFEEKTFLQGVDLSNSEFYNLADQSGIIPKTSQPTPKQFVDFYKSVSDEGDTILSIHVTSKLSGTYESAVIASRELEDQYKIIPIDSASGSASMGFMCKEARMLERSGSPVDTVVERMKSIAENVSIILTLDSLEYARKSGRVKALQAALASILKVKPIIILTDGVLELGERVRTRRKSLEYVLQATLERIGEKLVNAAVVHAEDPKAGDSLTDMVNEHMNINELILTELSTGIAANLGPGTAGIVAYPVE